MYVFNSHHLVLAKYLGSSEQGHEGNGEQRRKNTKENIFFWENVVNRTWHKNKVVTFACFLSKPK